MDLDSFLASSSNAKNKNMEVPQEQLNDLESELQEYCLVRLTSSKENVLKYRKDHRDTYPVLYKLATLFFQIAMTEVDVERLFSQVHFILDSLHLCLSDETLDEIMLIRCNFELFQTLKIPLVF